MFANNIQVDHTQQPNHCQFKRCVQRHNEEDVWPARKENLFIGAK